ncbi:YkvA family protein [Bacillus suaedaesalsae]|uniref:DUF1232 domain-containing protein n=1 Tax=Bacillus suaedaesalsae TaxID=2810349 RepID=A0ABS2DDG8_9BACI|nr:DUF1232 domain-containing protein [Bacillus suaedaesalsae]MBM6616504.1 DUF1232 domain-containing protein [Bacillus suaedaesalsae]
MLKLFKRLRFILKFWRFLPFLLDYFISKEVNLKEKLLSIALIAGYFIMPLDIIPDFLSFFGVLDDIMVASFVLQRIVRKAPSSLKEKHGLDKD